jgi:hypothetical protein
MKRNQETAEVTIQIDYATDLATVTVAEWPAMFNRCQRLYGAPARTTKQGSVMMSATWKIPSKNVTLRKLGKKALKAA